jgi:DNA-binding beta-propeller fold protein YncE
MSPTGFYGPLDMTIGPDGMLYVLNRATTPFDYWRVTKCLPQDDEYVDEFNGRTDDQPWPVGIALDSGGLFYMTDDSSNNVCVYDMDGQRVGMWGVAGDAPGQLAGPAGIRLDEDENLWIVDSANHRIQQFTREGVMLRCWGEHGGDPGQFSYPWGISLDPFSGDVFVADWRNDRVQRLTRDGEVVQVIGRKGAGDGEFDHPSGVTVDHYGDIYVADQGNNRVQLFNSRGRFVEKFAGDATINKRGVGRLLANPDMLRLRDNVPSIEPEKWLKKPTSVMVAPDDRVYMVDSGRFRVQVYQKHCIALGRDEVGPPISNAVID